MCASSSDELVALGGAVWGLKTWVTFVGGMYVFEWKKFLNVIKYRQKWL